MRRNQSTEREGRDDPDRQTNDNRFHSLIDNQAKHVARLRAERHPHADFAGALFHRISDCAVNPDAREQQRAAGKNSEQPRHQTRLSECLRDDRIHRLRYGNRQTRVHFVNRGLHGFGRSIEF